MESDKTAKYFLLNQSGMDCLREIGLTDSEVEVYLRLLELEPSAGGTLIKKSKLQSSTVYHALDRLAAKGLASFVVRENKKNYEATSPEFLLKITEQKKGEILRQEQGIRQLLPALLGKQKVAGRKSEATVYEGRAGIRAAFEDILKTLKRGDEYYVLGARGGLPLDWTRNFFMQFNKQCVKQGVRKKIIFNDDVRDTTGADEEKVALTEVRYLPQTTLAAINIYGNNVIIAVWVQEPLAFLIRSKEMSESYKQHFNELWRIARKPARR